MAQKLFLLFFFFSDYRPQGGWGTPLIRKLMKWIPQTGVPPLQMDSKNTFLKPSLLGMNFRENSKGVRVSFPKRGRGGQRPFQIHPKFGFD